jgi:inhibitor of cysteine peptidase
MFGFTPLAARFAPGLAALLLFAAAGFAMTGPVDDIAIAAADAGKAVALAVGQKLRVTLEAQPGTGFRWQPASTSTPLLSFSGTTLGGASMPGAPETQTLTFVARAPGAGKLTLVYRRAWEKNTPPAKTYSVMVKIAAQ